MTLQEFVLSIEGTPEFRLTEAQNHTEYSYRKIGGNEARQIFSMLGALAPIKASVASVTPVQVITGVETTLGELCESLLETLRIGQFATDPATEDGNLNRVAASILVTEGVLLQFQFDAFFGKSAVENKPFVNATLAQVKAIMWPPVKTICTHLDGSQAWIPSISNRDTFLFLIDAAEEVSRIKLGMRWRESAESPWVIHEVGSLQGGSGLFSRAFARPNGLGQGRLFEFCYTPEFAGQINSITVNLG